MLPLLDGFFANGLINIDILILIDLIESADMCQ